MGGIRFEPDGTVTIVTGTLDYGQGHASPFAQVLVDQLGVPFEKDQPAAGRFRPAASPAAAPAARVPSCRAAAPSSKPATYVIEQGKQSRRPHPRSRSRRHRVRPPAASASPAPTAASASWTSRKGFAAPPACRTTCRPALDVSLIFKGVPQRIPQWLPHRRSRNRPETGEMDVVSYSTVNDFGVLVNPMHGRRPGPWRHRPGHRPGPDRESWSTTKTARSCPAPTWTTPCPAPTTPRTSASPAIPCPPAPIRLGAKGCGEAGCAGSLPAVMNAVVDALSELGITHIDMPATPLKLWETIAAARR